MKSTPGLGNVGRLELQVWGAGKALLRDLPEDS